MFFAVCRCVTPAVNLDFMNMTTKVMTFADRRRYDEICEGLDDTMAEIPELLSIPTSSGSRRRRRSEDVDLREEMERVTTAITNLGQRKPFADSAALETIKAQSEIFGLIKIAFNMDHDRSLLPTRALPEADSELKELMKEHYASAKIQLHKLLKDL